jgi:nucleoside-triphosphatase THEP1
MPEQVGSPVSTPATLLSEDKHPQLLFITGPSGTGKSTYCLQHARLARSAALRLAGFIAIPVFRHSQKIAIDWIDQAGGERRRLAVRRQGETGKFSTANWRFDPAALQWGNEKLRHLPACDLLFLDELGPLELQQGAGLQAALPLIARRQIPLIIAVIRPALLPVAHERWPWGQVVDLAAQQETPARRVHP